MSEQQFIRSTAPTLAGLKTGSMFPYLPFSLSFLFCFPFPRSSAEARKSLGAVFHVPHLLATQHMLHFFQKFRPKFFTSFISVIMIP